MAGTRQRRAPITYADACAEIEAALRGPTRRDILESLSVGDRSRKAGTPLDRLRAAMRSHTFPTRSASLTLRRIVDTLDARSRREGLHVLQGWDFQAHRFTDDVAPVLLLDYCARLELPARDAPTTASLLLDQYFQSVLSLLTVRAWDDGDANENCDRVSALLDALHGPDGSGLRVVDDAETLFLLAVSYYHPDERCYGMLLEKVETLDAAHRLRMAMPCTAMLAEHLRWGLRFMYRRDVGRMRDDNVVDYPWLLFSVLTLARAHAPGESGAAGTPAASRLDALIDGLSADPWAFVGDQPACLNARDADHSELRAWLDGHREALLADADAVAPTPASYSPLGVACNFPANASVALVAAVLEDGHSWPVLNTLYAREGADPKERTAERLVRRLMTFSSEPTRLGARGAPLVIYDPHEGAHAFNTVVRVVRQGGAHGVAGVLP